MSIRFVPVTLDALRGTLQAYLQSLPSPVDSFVEDHIVESAHYRIYVADDLAGFTSLHKRSLITQFALDTSFKHMGQSVFAQIKKMEQIQAALVATRDEFFLSHALDEYRQITKQAYLFAVSSRASEENAPIPFTLRFAEAEDVSVIQEGSGDFFGTEEKIKQSIQKRELFLTYRDADCVGFGILARSELCGPVASIGMYIREAFRRQGAGTATLRLLQEQCRHEGLRPVAGCWYYNHLSKKTLERAGLFTQTRLLRIEY